MRAASRARPKRQSLAAKREEKREAKREERKAQAKVKLWSPERPERPEVDPLYWEIVQLMEHDRRSVWSKANESGLSTSTIRNWQRHKVKRPSGVSLQMAARMLGKRIRLE